jgi:hypothetical protein
VRGCARRGAGAPRVEVRSDTAYEDRPARRNRGSTWRDHLHENFVAQPISRRAQFGIQALHVRPPISTILSPPSDEGIKYWIRSTRLIGHLYNRPPLLSLTLAKSAALEWLSDRLDRPGSEGIQGVASPRRTDDQNAKTRFDFERRGFPFGVATQVPLLAKRRIAAPAQPSSGPGPPDGIGGGQSLESLGDILESRGRLFDRLSRRGLREALVDNLGDAVCSLFHIEIALIA